jgi:thiamine-phosphate pyrophosphorylase
MSQTCRLYLITPSRIDDPQAFVQSLDAALGHGDVAALQIRLKDTPIESIVAVTRLITPVAHRHGVAVLMNDHVDLAFDLKLDGVHLGQGDMPMAEARKCLGVQAMIGITCHNSRHLAMEASEASADYVAFGAFFPTTTKEVAYRAEPEILSIWQETMQTPCVAIGGIMADNAAEIIRAGADFIAVSSAVWGHSQGPEAGIAALQAVINAA